MMWLRITNWQDLQHYTDRRPTWVKLHLSLMDEMNWVVNLSHEARGFLMLLWLTAAKNGTDGTFDGRLSNLMFHTRDSEKNVRRLLAECIKWKCVSNDTDEQLTPDQVIQACADADQLCTTEKSREETETQKRERLLCARWAESFEKFWSTYEKPRGKREALLKWNGIPKKHFQNWRTATDEDWQKLLATILEGARKCALNTAQKYRPAAHRWLAHERWHDEYAGEGEHVVYDPTVVDYGESDLMEEADVSNAE